MVRAVLPRRVWNSRSLRVLLHSTYHLCPASPMIGPFRAFTSFFAALPFAFRHGLAWMFAVPIVLFVLISWGFFIVLHGPVDHLGALAADWLEISVEEANAGFWNDLKNVLNATREFVVAFVLRLAIAYLLFLVNKYIVLILLSPLLAYASERTEEIVTGRTFPFSWRQLLLDAIRGSLVALRNGVLELVVSLMLWALGLLVPILAPFTLVLLFLVSAYFYGFSMFDYMLERRRLRVSESVRAVNQRLGAVVTNGALFSLVMKVPLLGLLFGPVMAAIGAVLAEHGTTRTDASTIPYNAS